MKVPKTITHQAKLVAVDTLVARFAEEVRQLGGKLAILLVQLPPKLAFNSEVTKRVFEELRAAIGADIVCEPRNPTWFDKDADAMLQALHVGRVAADPALGAAAGSPGGWHGLPYWRLHGSPNIYRSSYGEDAIDTYAAQVRAAVAEGLEPWCIFDNTAASAATGNALSLMEKLRP